MQTYLVGGAVRDQLLNIQVKDRDWLVVGSSPEQLIEQGYQQVGADFPVFLHPDSKEEYALARTERKSGQGYQGFICDFSPEVTLEQDLMRRDLTINAIAQDEQGLLHDPYNGQQDLADKTLRHVSAAFQEDPLRVLRVARFAARFAHLGFSVAQETLQLMQDMSVSGELASLTAERVWQETQRALSEQSPDVFFQVLKDCQALKVIFPEIDALFGVPQPALHHPEIDCGIHTLMVLQQACKLSDDCQVRWAAINHDLGKALSDESMLPKHHGHEQKGAAQVKQLSQRIKAPKDYYLLADLACRFHTHCHRAFELKASTIVKLFNQLDVWRKPERFEQFLLVCIADSRGRTGFENIDYPQAEYLTKCLQACLQINIQEIVQQGFQGKEIREQLDKQRCQVVEQQKDLLKQD